LQDAGLTLKSTLMKTYRELEVYKISQTLAVKIHFMSSSLPKFELYEEGSQIRRSSKVITCAIVEGYGKRNYKKDFIKFLVIAITECDETIVHLDFLFNTKSLTDGNFYSEVYNSYVELSKRLNKFIQWVEKNWKPKD
jgi:four helix bundle protein